MGILLCSFSLPKTPAQLLRSAHAARLSRSRQCNRQRDPLLRLCQEKFVICSPGELRPSLGIFRLQVQGRGSSAGCKRFALPQADLVWWLFQAVLGYVGQKALPTLLLVQEGSAQPCQPPSCLAQAPHTSSFAPMGEPPASAVPHHKAGCGLASHISVGAGGPLEAPGEKAKGSFSWGNEVLGEQGGRRPPGTPCSKPLWGQQGAPHAPSFSTPQTCPKELQKSQQSVN